MTEKATPLVSIVIPTYNHARFLGRALQSAMDQTYVNWEAIVIDNHSTDNTDEVMASFTDPRITYLKIHNKGVIAASRNAGINAAKGKWIAFLDSDDWWTKDKLQACFDCIDEHVDLVYHDLVIVNDKKRFFSRKNVKSWQVKKPVLFDLLLNWSPITNSSVVVRKSLLVQINGINENIDMVGTEDYNTWLRIAQLTDHFVYLQRKLGYYLIHNQSISQKDMTLSTRTAIAEFSNLLNEQQKIKLEANIIYIKGCFNYLANNHTIAKKDFRFVIICGYWMLRIKSAVLLSMLISKRIFGISLL